MTRFIIQDVRLFDGDQVIDNGSVLVVDGIIKQVQIGQIDHDGDVEIISVPGHVLLPGFIDAHCHPYADPSLSEQAFRFGITTLMDMHNVHENALLQKQWAKERKDFPDVKSSHYAATIWGGWPAFVEMKLANSENSKFEKYPNVNCEDAAELFVKQSVANGSDYIKLMHEGGHATGLEGQLVQPAETVQAAVVKAAHRLDKKVVAHALSRKDTIEILRAGADGLTHTFYDEPINQEVINLYQRNKAWLNPTLVASGSLTGESKEIMAGFAADPRIIRRAAPDTVGLLHRCLHMKSLDAKWEYAIDSVRQLKAAGIDIICGSDTAAGVPGLSFGASLIIEMHLLVTKAGLSPLEVLRGTTSLTADRFGWSDRGRIAPGLKADLVLVEGDPFTTITDLLNVRGIWRDGVKFKGHQGFAL